MILILAPPNSGSSIIFQLCSQGSLLPIPVRQNPWNVKVDHIPDQTGIENFGF